MRVLFFIEPMAVGTYPISLQPFRHKNVTDRQTSDRQTELLSKVFRNNNKIRINILFHEELRIKSGTIFRLT